MAVAQVVAVAAHRPGRSLPSPKILQPQAHARSTAAPHGAARLFRRPPRGARSLTTPIRRRGSRSQMAQAPFQQTTARLGPRVLYPGCLISVWRTTGRLTARRRKHRVELTTSLFHLQIQRRGRNAVSPATTSLQTWRDLLSGPGRLSFSSGSRRFLVSSPALQLRPPRPTA